MNSITQAENTIQKLNLEQKRNALSINHLTDLIRIDPEKTNENEDQLRKLTLLNEKLLYDIEEEKKSLVYL